MNWPLPIDAPSHDQLRIVNMPRQNQQPEPFANYGDLLSVRDLCALTGLSAQTIRTSCASGQLPAVKIGRAWFVPKANLMTYIGAA